jgi:hypothetical protein
VTLQCDHPNEPRCEKSGRYIVERPDQTVDDLFCIDHAPDGARPIGDEASWAMAARQMADVQTSLAFGG